MRGHGTAEAGIEVFEMPRVSGLCAGPDGRGADRGNGVMAYAYQTAYDLLVWEAADYLQVKKVGWISRRNLVKDLAIKFKLGWSTADRVVDDLYKLGILEANYGFLKLSRVSI